MAMIEQRVARGQDLFAGRSPWTTQTARRLHGYVSALDGSLHPMTMAKIASSLFGVGKYQTAKRRYSAVGGGGSQRAVLVFGFERGSDSIAVAAVGMWKSGLWAISKGGVSGVNYFSLSATIISPYRVASRGYVTRL